MAVAEFDFMKSWDALLIQSLQTRAVDKVPARFKTIAEWAKIHDKSRKAVDDLFTKLKLEKKQYRIISGNQIRNVWHWAQG